MLKHRVIPVVLINGFSVLKTINFEARRNLGSPVTVVRTYNTRNVDELVILDIDASKYNRDLDVFTIKDMAGECFMPLTVGGGIHSLDAMGELLNAGADKVSINSRVLRDPELVSLGARKFGSQCIVVSIDYKFIDNDYFVYDHTTKQTTDIKLVDWCQEMEKRKAGELFLTSVDREGTFLGPDFEAVEKVSSKCRLPIISNGGVSSLDDCAHLIQRGADAVAASSIFHFSSITPASCREKMREKGISVRS